MYQEYFNLTSLPFENSPDPEFFFMGERHREILALMIHGVVSRKGLVCITGPIGSGKTTLAAVLIKHLPEDALVINLTHAKASPDEMLTYLAEQLGRVHPPKTPLLLTEAIREELIKLDNQDRHSVLIIDEAQYMSDALMREIVVLTNLETPRRKLIQILLLGQKEFLDKLNRPELRQLKHRIFVMRALTELDPEQSYYYIKHRLEVASGDIALFSMDALDLIIKYSGGIPRLINRLCDAALLGAFTGGGERVEEKDVRNANIDLGMELGIQASSHRETLRRSMRIRRSAAFEESASRIQPAPSPPSSGESNDISAQRPTLEITHEISASKDASLGKTPSAPNRPAFTVPEHQRPRRQRFKMIMFLLVLAALLIGIIINFRGKNFKLAFIGAPKPDNPEENTRATREGDSGPRPGLLEPQPSVAPRDPESGSRDKNKIGRSAQPPKEARPSGPTAADLKAELERAVSDNTVAKKEKPGDPVTLQGQQEPKSQPLTHSPGSAPTDTPRDKSVGPMSSASAALQNTTAAKEKPRPYSLFLDSLAGHDAAVNAITQFKQKGFDPYWVKLENKGGKERYNIYAGYFESVEQAERAMQKASRNGKNNHAMIMKTPYAALVGVFTSSAVLEASQLLLDEAGYSSYCIPGEDSGHTRLYVGAFYKIEDARKRCSELIDIDVPCRAVAR